MPRHFDVAGAAVFTAALVALVLAATWAAERSAGPATAAALAVSMLGFVAFFVVELRAPEPLVPLRLFANRTIAAGTALSAIIGVGLFSITAYLPTYIQMAYRTTATVSGLVPIATVFGMLISNLLTGWLASRTGRYRIFPILGTSLGAAGLFVMALLPAGLPLWVPMIVMAVVGIGTGAFMSLIVAVVQRAAPASQTGTITATDQPRAPGRLDSGDRDHRRGDRLRRGGPLAGGPGRLHPDPATGQRGRPGSPGQVAQIYGFSLRTHLHCLGGHVRRGNRRGGPASARAPLRRTRSRPPKQLPNPFRPDFKGDTMSNPTIAIVGSGPIGSTYARVLLEQVPDARVVMFEAGPQVTRVPGAERPQHRRP